MEVYMVKKYMITFGQPEKIKLGLKYLLDQDQVDYLDYVKKEKRHLYDKEENPVLAVFGPKDKLWEIYKYLEDNNKACFEIRLERIN